MTQKYQQTSGFLIPAKVHQQMTVVVNGGKRVNIVVPVLYCFVLSGKIWSVKLLGSRYLMSSNHL